MSFLETYALVASIFLAAGLILLVSDPDGLYRFMTKYRFSPGVAFGCLLLAELVKAAFWPITGLVYAARLVPVAMRRRLAAWLRAKADALANGGHSNDTTSPAGDPSPDTESDDRP